MITVEGWVQEVFTYNIIYRSTESPDCILMQTLLQVFYFYFKLSRSMIDAHESGSVTDAFLNDPKIEGYGVAETRRNVEMDD